MAHFYLTLPSNSSMNYYPKNTLTRYTTRLENAISLVGDWEVGLFEIQYPHSWFNLEKNEAGFAYTHNVEVDGRLERQHSVMRLPSGHYDTPMELTRTITELLEENMAKHQPHAFPKFRYSPITNRIYTAMPKTTMIQFSPALCGMLGIGNRQNPIKNTNVAAPTDFIGENACDVNRGFSSAYVYCNILEHIPVGHTKAPLLRIVSVSGKRGETIRTTYEKPLYVPLQQKAFDSIEIDIRSDTGDPIPFEYGKVLVTLHFRLRKIPYLLQ